MMPVVEESATTIGSQTTTGPITGVAILMKARLVSTLSTMRIVKQSREIQILFRQ